MTTCLILNPFRRGFFCDDESIQLPYFDSTVSTDVMYSIGLSIPVLLILWGEYAYIEHQKVTRSSNDHDGKHKTWQYSKNVCRKVICFFSGALYQYLIIGVGKVTVSRLRPNFIAVCGIDLASVCRNSTDEYISNYTCPNGDDAADESRVSFPSGHACFSFYAAVFTVLYLQTRLQFGTLFWKPLLQFCIILLAWWVSLSRIMDNQHHLSDVIAGIFLGSTIALINTIFVHSFLKDVAMEPVSILNSNGDSVKGAMSETTGLLRSNSEESVEYSTM